MREAWNKGLKMSHEFKKKVSQTLIGKTESLGRNWKGDKAGYHALHIWIKKKNGKPTRCTIDSRHFGNRYEWASISRENKRDIADWIELCPSCHRIYDRYKLNIKQLYERTHN